MLDIALAVTVVTAVVFVGLLISIGNERQRRALEGLRESLREWAINDLKLKRARAEREINVQEPIIWLEEKAAVGLGFIPEIRELVKVIQHPRALEVETSDGLFLVFSPLNPGILMKMCNKTRSHRGLLNEAPELLGKQPKSAEAYELSTLNAGVFFDVELSQVWQQLAGAKLETERLWMYVVKP
jgi:hypothetical protein